MSSNKIKKLSYSGKKISRRTLINKEEKQAPGFKAGRDRLTPLFCANAVGFRIKTALIYKAVKPWALKGKDKHQLPILFLYNKKAGTMRTLYLDWFYQCFIPEVRKYLACEGLPFKVLWFGALSWPTRTPSVQHWRCKSGLLAPKYNIASSVSRSGGS